MFLRLKRVDTKGHNGRHRRLIGANMVAHGACSCKGSRSTPRNEGPLTITTTLLCFMTKASARFCKNQLVEKLRRMKKNTSTYVLTDESTQATEPECFIRLVLGAKQVLVESAHAFGYSLVVNMKPWSSGVEDLYH